MNSIQMNPADARSPGVGEIPAVLLPTADQRYARRAARLRQLADGHPMADYLRFVARIAEVQQQLLEQLPLPSEAIAGLPARLGQGQAPLAWAQLARDAYWQRLLQHLITALHSDVNAGIAATLERLAELDPQALEVKAGALLAGQYDQVDSGQALFLWAALTLYFSQLATHLPGSGQALVGEHRQHCPVCNSAPVASVIQTGALAGLRYLHCGLCESRWHMVRLKCSNCEATGQLDYWSPEHQQSPLKAESCNDCEGYLKVFYPEHDRELEVLADDLASLALDAEVERLGFARTGVSPFLFPG
ncbi:formate dehydrogenase accessory protein FdhE [Pseudomonas sp. SDI]|uniref:formate dehydrogenase accessory protein FdhE n=1 Tax=Pseudomonas sp. SDI TaxID=2170734 RepID=UPI000DE5D738|nr:formate dehydrogenase accessory protein FdhE [Pseudomonas sp. SDI]PWB32369.1 formate dehydrogenase accessory protein FdhE [Pseudomonas sp. SDI]